MRSIDKKFTDYDVPEINLDPITSVRYRWWRSNRAYPKWDMTCWSANTVDEAVELLSLDMTKGLSGKYNLKLVKETVSETFEEIVIHSSD